MAQNRRPDWVFGDDDLTVEVLKSIREAMQAAGPFARRWYGYTYEFHAETTSGTSTGASGFTVGGEVPHAEREQRRREQRQVRILDRLRTIRNRLADYVGTGEADRYTLEEYAEAIVRMAKKPGRPGLELHSNNRRTAKLLLASLLWAPVRKKPPGIEVFA